MCYNCGCQMHDNPMSKGHAGAEKDGKSVTNKTFEEAGISMKMNTEDSKKNALDLLKKSFRRESRTDVVCGINLARSVLELGASS